MSDEDGIVSEFGHSPEKITNNSPNGKFEQKIDQTAQIAGQDTSSSAMSKEAFDHMKNAGGQTGIDEAKSLLNWQRSALLAQPTEKLNQ